MIIGVTGSIGAGKSSVAGALRDEVGRLAGSAHRQACVLFDADRVARDVLIEKLPLVAREFGADVVREDGSPDRALIAERAFATAESAHRLNEMIHPDVVERARAEIAALRETNAAVILDVPLLFESGMNALCDVVVVVTADDALRRERAGRFGDVKARERYQWSQEEKAAKADHVITNNGTLRELLEKTAVLAEKILSAKK